MACVYQQLRAGWSQVVHEHAKHFIFLTPVVPDFLTMRGVVRAVALVISALSSQVPCRRQMSVPNYVTYPYFHVVHWTLYKMLHMQEFNATAVEASKDTLVAQSYVVRQVRPMLANISTNISTD